ncbi:MAG: DUF4340 domain-containing protein [Anaerolineae bacterium]
MAGGRLPVFQPKLLDFWSAVSDIDGAQLVARNPANHSRMGVADGQGTVMEFFLGGSIQEQFLVGEWSPDVRLCYLRRPSKNEVYSIPCASPDVFDADPDGWRNRIVLSIPRTAVESIAFTSPEEDFTVAITPLGSVLISEDGQEPADNGLVLNILLALENLPEATGFASEEEMEDLRFDASTPSIVVNTLEESGFQTTRLRFIPRDDLSYYVKTPRNALFISWTATWWSSSSRARRTLPCPPEDSQRRLEGLAHFEGWSAPKPQSTTKREVEPRWRPW